MKPTHHMLISGGVTLVFSLWVKSKVALLTCFLSGIFIDLDHFIDYIAARKTITLNYRKFSDFFKYERRAKLLILFHAYEWLAILWFAIFYANLGPIWIGLAIGLTSHMLCDEIFNPLRPLSYFLTYRIMQNFDRGKLYKRSYANVMFRED